MKISLPRLLATLAASLCATAALAADGAVAAAQAQLTRMTPASKIECRADGYGGATCTADGYSVNLGDCGDGAAFGSIAADGGLDLNDRIDGEGSPVAHVQDRQFVCIPAMARKGETQRHYVIVVPTASVPECRDNALCKDADLPVQWKAAKSGQACQRGKDDNYIGDCPAGWVDVGQIDQYDTLAPMPAKQAK
ncbi:hypothetical protein [Achromobacter sp. UMC71]|uniref:hypothetical protein n=1 Tax=Achromobacter sp. UMC71 TaxID=1862320 RepID=UPI00160120BD|nr:hypothetical protein [Achromobacter sp. UMC71]MBB1626574.1 hypothetical protein [Achromobacter sp. UMC71]